MLGQAEVGSWGLNLGIPLGWWGSKDSTYHLLPPRVLIRSKSELGVEPGPNLGIPIWEMDDPSGKLTAAPNACPIVNYFRHTRAPAIFLLEHLASVPIDNDMATRRTNETQHV